MSSRGELPIGPFREWLESLTGKYGMIELGGRLGVGERRVRTWLGESDNRSGKPQATIRLDTVDRALCRFGDPFLLSELYPIEGEVS